MGSREAVKVASWIKPKMSHKHMLQKLLQVRAHLILCFRAEEKIEIIKEDGKTKIVPKQSLTGLDGWIPICEKNLPFELTASFLLTASAPGIPRPIKLQEQHRPLFPLDKPVTEESGRLIAQWASGGKAQAHAAAAPTMPEGVVEDWVCTIEAAGIDELDGVKKAGLAARARAELASSMVERRAVMPRSVVVMLYYINTRPTQRVWPRHKSNQELRVRYALQPW